MNLNAHTSRPNSLYLSHVGWRYYNTIKKKAMEQEFSLSGLVVSLSIAFFIVIMTAVSLNILKNSMINAGIGEGGADDLPRIENFNTYSSQDSLKPVKTPTILQPVNIKVG